MKKQFLLIIALMACLSGLFAQNIQSIAVGTVLPAQTTKLKDVSGKEITLVEAKGEKGLLVMFSCNTCPYVVKNQDRTKQICNYAKEKGLGVVLINSNAAQREGSDSFDAMKKYAKNQAYNWYYVTDDGSAVADAFGAARTPEVFVFDKNDKLVYKGAIDDNPSDGSAVKKQHLKNAIDETLNGTEVTVKESRSVGCGIKRIS